jgi:membrane-associated phospholipid phosphatase
LNDFSALSAGVSYNQYLAGLEWIRAIQSAAFPLATSVFKIITALVSEYIFFLFLPALYWFWDEKKAFRLGCLAVVSLWLNDMLKVLFRMPRPFHLEPALGMIYQEGYGFPSGHAQLSLTLIFPLAFWLAQRFTKPLYRLLVWAAAALVILAVGFSRLYLGVHFPQDIAGGWILGALLLAAFFFLQSPFCSALRARLGSFLTGKLPAAPSRRSWFPACAALALVSLLMNALDPGNVLPGALFLGFCSGFVLMKRYFPFTAVSHRGVKGCLWFFAGFAGALLIYLGLKMLFPIPGHPLYRIFRFVRYALTAFWIGCGMPLQFRRRNAGT